MWLTRVAGGAVNGSPEYLSAVSALTGLSVTCKAVSHGVPPHVDLLLTHQYACHSHR